MENSDISLPEASDKNPLAHNIRKFRLSMNLTQAELSEMASIPRATIASMESDHGNPSFYSVQNIARALGVSISDLMADNIPAKVTKVKREDMRVTRLDDNKYMSTSLTPLNAGSTQINEISMLPGCDAKGKPHPKGADEFFLVSEGIAIVDVGGEEVTVEPGDLIFFPGNQPHRYINRSNKPVHAFSFITMPKKSKKKDAV
jgi:XRE family transcriptional regulator, regulator of sulfur utilization